MGQPPGYSAEQKRQDLGERFFSEEFVQHPCYSDPYLPEGHNLPATRPNGAFTAFFPQSSLPSLIPLDRLPNDPEGINCKQEPDDCVPGYMPSGRLPEHSSGVQHSGPAVMTSRPMYAPPDYGRHQSDPQMLPEGLPSGYMNLPSMQHHASSFPQGQGLPLPDFFGANQRQFTNCSNHSDMPFMSYPPQASQRQAEAGLKADPAGYQDPSYQNPSSSLVMCNNYLMSLPRPPYPYPQFPNVGGESLAYVKELQRSNPTSQPMAMLGSEQKARTTIGKLSMEERRAKIDKYRAKRHKRIWRKRISYSCRKRVADKRLRIKGRFVSKEEAQGLMLETHESGKPIMMNGHDPSNLGPYTGSTKIPPYAGKTEANPNVSINSNANSNSNGKKKKVVRKIFNIISTNAQSEL